VLFGVIAIIALLHFAVGWEHVPAHIGEVRAYFSRSGEEPADKATESDGVASIDTAVAAPKVLLDTIFWKQEIANGNFVPDDVRVEYEEAVRYDYTHLQVSDEQPTDEEAESAILYRYKDHVKKLLEQKKAHIRIGKCYRAQVADGSNGKEIARVTAMIGAFDREGNNLGNIQMPLSVAYDFVQYESDPGVWYISDMSQTIPYDYQLY